MIKNLLGQIICGIRYLHKNGVTHQDLKPDNVVITDEGNIAKIIDLGISNNYAATRVTRAAGKGTFYYRSPEMMTGKLT